MGIKGNCKKASARFQVSPFPPHKNHPGAEGRKTTYTPLPTSGWPQKLCLNTQLLFRERGFRSHRGSCPGSHSSLSESLGKSFPSSSWSVSWAMHKVPLLQHRGRSAPALWAGGEAGPSCFSARAGEQLLSAPSKGSRLFWGPWLSPSAVTYQATPRQFRADQAFLTYTLRNYTAPEVFTSRNVIPWWQCPQNDLGANVWSMQQPAQELQVLCCWRVFCHRADPERCRALKPDCAIRKHFLRTT